MCWAYKRTFCFIISLILLFFAWAPAYAYTVHSCWTSAEGWGGAVANFSTSSDAVFLNIRDTTLPLLMIKRWYRPDGTQETDIGTKLLAKPVYEGSIYVGQYSYMVIGGYDREPGQWNVEYLVRDIHNVWHSMCRSFFTIGQAVANPVFTPPPGTYADPQSVEITCATPSATIRYTKDGSEPSTNSQVYSIPIQVSKTITIKAKSFKSGELPSETVTGTYTIGRPLNSIYLLLLKD